ncbi:GIY-YIG nuclease family protein [Cloacibacillus sp.]|uniref:GIY-YIG nuclease family protein n=1 Tax=Cloacibacillus sp. TaxID=2049023 RepID=UPI0025BA9BAA|nr:hypothetical protein [Cloacibacillus sp.]MCC8056455.1 hypothetical protein [Cloacibacillus sp.]
MCIDIKSVLEKCEEYTPLPGYYFCVMSNFYAFNNIENSELKELVVDRLKQNGNILYVGIGKDDVRVRAFNHVLGNSLNSTLRKSLSVILKKDKQKLSEWIKSNIKILYITCKTGKEAESAEDTYIEKLKPPLNLIPRGNNPRIEKIMEILRNPK